VGGELAPGAPFVLDRIGFRRAARRAQLVVTGEGIVDATTAEGKAPAEAWRVCSEEGVRCVVFGGRIEAPLPGAELRELSGRPETAEQDLAALGERLGRELVE